MLTQIDTFLASFMEWTAWSMIRPQSYGPFHLIWTVAALIICPILAWRLKNVSEKANRYILLGIGIFLVLSAIVENRYGSMRLFISIVITAFVSGFIHFVFFPTTVLLGASGIVFMMIFLASMANSKGGVIPVSLILVALIYLGKEVWALFLTNDNISQLTHIIGGICGIIFGKCSSKR